MVGWQRVVVVLSLLISLSTIGVLDVDGDDRDIASEIVGGTDPVDSDSDGDGLDDGAEGNVDADPNDSDTDGDGLDDGAEVNEYGSDPAVEDTDGDGLDDGTERDVNSDPTVADTDGDGLSDDAEVHEHGTDPAAEDTDGDDVDDGTEVEQWETDPTTGDTDRDDLSDSREVRELGSDPLKMDSDRDGLPDAVEVNDVGTDVSYYDTDGDGISDGDELTMSGPARGDPFRMDVFVEVDYMEGHRPSEQGLETVTRAYRDAPVDNPDGSTGITLHLVVDDKIPREETTDGDDVDRILRENMDYGDQQYHYGVAVSDPRNDGQASGFAASGRQFGQFVFRTEYRSGRTYSAQDQADVVMHELGHSVGLRSDMYEGIDSTAVPYEEYTSVMNYDAPDGTVRYSRGEPFDDWSHIEEQIYTPSPNEMSRFPKAEEST